MARYSTFLITCLCTLFSPALNAQDVIILHPFIGEWIEEGEASRIKFERFVMNFPKTYPDSVQIVSDEASHGYYVYYQSASGEPQMAMISLSSFVQLTKSVSNRLRSLEQSWEALENMDGQQIGVEMVRGDVIYGALQSIQRD